MKQKRSNTSDGVANALAILIASTRTRKRPVALTEVADALDVAKKQLGGYAAVADRIGISTKMLRQFSYVDRLAPALRELFRTRRLDSVDAAVHLSMLSKREQSELAASLASGDTDSTDVRGVVELRHRDRIETPITQLLEKVKQSKTRQEYVVEFVIRGDRSDAKIFERIKAHVPAKEILRIERHGALGRLILTRTGKAHLSRAAKALGTRLVNVVPEILRD